MYTDRRTFIEITDVSDLEAAKLLRGNNREIRMMTLVLTLVAARVATGETRRSP